MMNEHLIDQRLQDWGEDLPYQPVIKVMGLGGGGSNAVDRMIDLASQGWILLLPIPTAKQWLSARRLSDFNWDLN